MACSRIVYTALVCPSHVGPSLHLTKELVLDRLGVQALDRFVIKRNCVYWISFDLIVSCVSVCMNIDF